MTGAFFTADDLAGMEPSYECPTGRFLEDLMLPTPELMITVHSRSPDTDLDGWSVAPATSHGPEAQGPCTIQVPNLFFS